MADYEVPSCPSPDDPEYVALWDQYQAILAHNTRKEAGLIIRFGDNARLDESSGMAARMEMITNAIIPINTPERLRLEIEWQELVEKSLENLQDQIEQSIQDQKNKKSDSKIVVPQANKKLILP